VSLLVLKNFRIADETTDSFGSVVAEDGVIRNVCINSGSGSEINSAEKNEGIVIDGSKQNLVLMPAFVDLHAHFRDPGCHEKEARMPSEVLESASLAAAAGGYGTVICMANTKPVTDTIAQAGSIKTRSDALGLIDLYPCLSLTKGMEGRELSEITLLREKPEADSVVLLVSEDGRDVADDRLFLAAMTEACRIGIPVSCHCDLGGENNATKRVLELGKQPRCRLHIAHVSTKEAISMIREAKKIFANLTCEVTPHHLALTAEAAAAMGEETHGRVNPPLRTEEDRRALISAIIDNTVDAIATDHAPHTRTDKENGAPGFTGLETAFAVCYSTLVLPGFIGLSKLSSLMSAAPARILGLGSNNCSGRGRIAPGMRADFAIADLAETWTISTSAFMSRGKNSPFAGRECNGRIVKTILNGRIVYERSKS